MPEQRYIAFDAVSDAGIGTMTKPVVGVIGNAHTVEKRFTAQLVGERNLRAVADVAGALPLMFAGSPEITDIDALLSAVDGILLTGARANVHPTRFGVEAHPRHEPYDDARDELALRLAKTAVARGVPLLGICRGFQEINVAFGGTLHPEIRELPGRMNHRMPRLPGDHRRVGGHAPSGNPRAARPHDPPHATARKRRDPSRSAGDLRRPPRCDAHARRRVRENSRLRVHPGELAARPGHRRAR